jgi:hypothetical protein
MKQAFEVGDAAPENNPAAPAPKTPLKATPKKSKAATTDGEATPTPKRKRATPKKKGTDEDEAKVKPEPEIEDEDEDEEMESPTKKPKVAKPRATRKAKAKSKMEVKVDEDADMVTSEPSTPVKSEEGDGRHDGFVDVKEWVSDLVGKDEDTEEESAERKFFLFLDFSVCTPDWGCAVHVLHENSLTHRRAGVNEWLAETV